MGPHMFRSATVDILVEEHISDTHPLRPIRSWVRAAADTIPVVHDLEGREVATALAWRALHSLPNEDALFDALRFDLRCQWFVGFVLGPREWRHETFWAAAETLITHRPGQDFFGGLANFLANEAFVDDRRLRVDIDLLRTWANPTHLLPSDGPGPRRPKAPEWQNFQGPRQPSPLPAARYRPGFAPTTPLAVQVSAHRAITNARLTRPNASSGRVEETNGLVTRLVSELFASQE